MNWVGRAADPAVTRQRLLAAAEAEVGERGIAATSLDAVAKRAGLTKGAIYSTFGSRAELILAMVDALPHPEIDVEASDPALVDAEALGTQLARAADEAPEQVFLLLELMAQAHRDAGLHLRMTQRVTESERRVRDRLVAQLGAGTEEAKALAVRFHAQLVGLWAMRALLGPDRVPDSAFIDVVRDLGAAVERRA
jgi:AcrR family transcriptional regulator